MKSVIIVLGLISLFSVSQAKTIEAGCSFRINNDLPEPQPLFLIPGGSKDVHGFYLPEGANGVVAIASGRSVLLACPGNDNSINNTNIGIKTALATCNSSTFFVNSVAYNFSNFACRSLPWFTARYSGTTCYDNTKRHIEIGFEVDSYFYRLMDVCFDDVLYTTLYVKATVVSGIAGFQKGYKRPGYLEDNFYPEMSVNTLYGITKQKQTISALLGSTLLVDHYINGTTDLFLSHGHLSAMTDYVYGSQQRATFFNVNISPQWQTFNGGNWEALESSVRDYADKKKLDLEVYTGTYGVATLPNFHGVETELYLFVDVNNKKAIPVPKLFWKAVYDPKSQAGVVVVGINNPHVSNPQEDYFICIDVCSKISWLKWDQENITKGHLYCCDVNDFRSTVKTLPQFTVSGLLTGGSSSLRLGHYFNLVVLMAGILKFL